MSGSNSNPAGEAVTPEPLHQPFAWHSIAHDSPFRLPADQAGSVLDLAAGMRTALELIERNQLLLDDADPQGRPGAPLLSPFDESGLMRLCIAVAKVLTREAGRELQRLRQQDVRRLSGLSEGSK